jgi:hypothetical protein
MKRKAPTPERCPKPLKINQSRLHLMTRGTKERARIPPNSLRKLLPKEKTMPTYKKADMTPTTKMNNSRHEGHGPTPIGSPVVPGANALPSANAALILKEAARLSHRRHLVIRLPAPQIHQVLLPVKCPEQAEPLIEVRADNEDPPGQEVTQATKVRQDLQAHRGYTAKEAPPECEGTPDLPDRLDPQGHQDLLVPTRQGRTGSPAWDTKKNSRLPNFQLLTEPKIPTELGRRRAMLIFTTVNSQLLLKISEE